MVAKNIHKAYGNLEVLKGVDIELPPGRLTALLGSSGAGKTTLLQILGTLDKPDKGALFFDQLNLSDLSANKLAHFRNRSLGFVFQFHNLMAEFTALENVCMPAYIQGLSRREARKQAGALLERLQLGHRIDHRPAELSGGEKQRVAVARALMNQPKVILADEPTGNLDTVNGEILFALFKQLAEEAGISILVATHNLHLAETCHRCLTIRDGQMLLEA